MADYSIRALTLHDMPVFKELRLEMLREYPQFCSKSYDDALKETNHDWSLFFAQGWSQPFVAYDSTTYFGLANISRMSKNTAKAVVELVYLRSHYQQKNLNSKKYLFSLLSHCANWAMRQGNLTTLAVSCRISQKKTLSILKKTILTYTSMNKATWADGTVDDMVWYETSLRGIHTPHQLLRRSMAV
ncbi:MAG: hypothetical protein EBQ89_01520 [Alphaproteobacteria bacterium]|nr:hypothetical protein [Alphaproteobacteria bacterium]